MILGIDVRGAFLRTAALARGVLAAPEVATAWDADSVLAQLSVRGLAGHLARGAQTVDDYLGAGFPGDSHEVGDAAGYYVAAALTSDIDDALNRSIRERGEEASAGGPVALVAEFDALRERLAARLDDEPDDARIAVRGGMVLPLDEYLVSRLIELAVHTDDLALSAGIAPPAPDPDAATLAVHCLVTLARRRHGDLAVLRALTRRERDDAEALRAF